MVRRVGRPRSVEPRHGNAAQRLLCALRDADEFVPKGLARETGILYETLLGYLNDGKIPRATHQKILSERFDIEPSWWSRGWDDLDEPEVADEDDESEDDAHDDAFVEDFDFSDPDAASKAIEAQCTRLRRDIRKARDPRNLFESTSVVKLEAEYRRACQDLAKLRHELGPADENKMVRTATFQRFKQRLLAALEQHPEVWDAVRAEFRSVEA
jgi:transcriptional regulator with XRE-family HTH domain